MLRSWNLRFGKNPTPYKSIETPTSEIVLLGEPSGFELQVLAAEKGSNLQVSPLLCQGTWRMTLSTAVRIRTPRK